METAHSLTKVGLWKRNWVQTMWVKWLVLTIVLVLGSSGIAGMTAADQTVPRVAFFGFQLINTSPQPTTPEETQRIRMLDDMFQQKLDASGRFKMAAIPSELRDKIASAIAMAVSVTLLSKLGPTGPLGAPCRKSAISF
jgi:hypothetical protein